VATTKGKLLTQDERELCEKITALNKAPASPRAQALLLLDAGHTQVKSCELSSLTLGQLRYLLRLFKQKGINLFPDNLFPPKEIKVEKTTASTEPEFPVKIPPNLKKVKRKKRKRKRKRKKLLIKRRKNQKRWRRKKSSS